MLDFVLGIVYMSWAAVGGGREDVVVPLLLPPLVPRLAGGLTHLRVWVGEQLFADRNCHSGGGVAGVSVEVPVPAPFSSGSLPGLLLL